MAYLSRGCWLFVLLHWIFQEGIVFGLSLGISTGIYLLKRAKIISLVLIPFFLDFSNFSLPFLRTQLGGFPGIDSPIKYLLSCFKSFVPGLRSDIEKDKAISDKIALDEMVKRSLCWKTGGVIDLKQIQFISVIDHKIKTEDLVTHIIVEIVGLGYSVLMLKMGLTWNKCLSDSLFNSTPILVGGQSNSFQSLEKLGQRFFMS